MLSDEDKDKFEIEIGKLQLQINHWQALIDEATEKKMMFVRVWNEALRPRKQDSPC